MLWLIGNIYDIQFVVWYKPGYVNSYVTSKLVLFNKKMRGLVKADKYVMLFLNSKSCLRKTDKVIDYQIFFKKNSSQRVEKKCVHFILLLNNQKMNAYKKALIFTVKMSTKSIE